MKLQHNQHGTHNICHAHSTFIWLPQKRLYHSSYVTPQVLRPQVTQRNFYDIANWPRQLARGFEILKWLFFLLCCPSAGLWSCASSFCIFCWLRDSRDSTRMVFGQRFLWERLEQRVCWLIFPGICNVCCTQAQVYDTRSSHKSRRGNFVTHYAHSHHGSKIGSVVGWFLKKKFAKITFRETLKTIVIFIKASHPGFNQSVCVFMHKSHQIFNFLQPRCSSFFSLSQLYKPKQRLFDIFSHSIFTDGEGSNAGNGRM